MRLLFDIAVRSAAFRATIGTCIWLFTFIFATSGRAQIPRNGLVAKYDFNLNADNSVIGPGAAPNGEIFGASPTPDRFGISNRAFEYDGVSDYIQFADSDAFSITTTGYLSISAWVRPDGTSLDANGRLLFSDWEESGYVYWMGKGVEGQHEWAFRIYSADNSEGRINRMSFYIFNPIEIDHLGPGSYVQDPVQPGQWLYFVAVVRTDDESITWYKNGVQRDRDLFDESQGMFSVTPVNGTEPVRVGMRNSRSHFAGAVDDIRIYNRALTIAEIVELFNELPGDFNGDGRVDAADYVVLRKGLPPLDFTTEYNNWRANFDRTTGSIPANSGSNRSDLVPESGTVPMAACILPALLSRRRMRSGE